MASTITIKQDNGVYICTCDVAEGMLGYEVVGYSKHSPIRALEDFNMGLFKKSNAWKRANLKIEIKQAGGLWKWIFTRKNINLSNKTM